MSLIDNIKTKTLHMRGVFEDDSDLPSNAKEGDYGVVLSTKTFWIYGNGSWRNSGGTGGGGGGTTYFDQIVGEPTTNTKLNAALNLKASVADLTAEIMDRTNADATLQTAIETEATNRTNADATLQTAINLKANCVSGGTANNILLLDATGNPIDSGKRIVENITSLSDEEMNNSIGTVKAFTDTITPAIGNLQNLINLKASTKNLVLRYDNNSFQYHVGQIIIDSLSNDNAIVLEDFVSDAGLKFDTLIQQNRIRIIPLGSRTPYPSLDNPDQNTLYNNANGFGVDSKIEYNGQVWVYLLEDENGIPTWSLKDDVIEFGRSFNLLNNYANGTIIVVRNAIGMPNSDYLENPIPANLFTKSFRVNYIINDTRPLFDILDANGNLLNQLRLEFLSSSENPIKNDDDLLLSNNNLGYTNQGDLNDALTNQISSKLNNTVATFVEQSSTPLTPNAGQLSFYAKTDDKLYYLNSAGAEVEVGAGSATVSSGELEPIGTVKAYYGKIAPQGYLICDGSTYSQTIYESLWAFATSEGLTTTTAANKGLFFDNGDGTFKVPDLRGYFLRGLGGVDPTAGRVMGSIQLDDFKIHQHETMFFDNESKDRYFGEGRTMDVCRGSKNRVNEDIVNEAGNIGEGDELSALTSGVGGSETRPVNIAVNYIIKAQVIGGASIVGGLTYKGSWDATTNTPTLPNVNDQNGFYYKVSVSGNTNISGISNWDVGDWIIFNGSNYDQIANYEAVNSVNGKLGNIVITATDVGLSNVDNTSDANKPISTATQTALNLKEDTITAGTSSDYYRGDKTFQTLDKTAVGLENVDNTSDVNKPVSTATQTALNLKEDTITAGTSSDYYRGDKTFQTLNAAAVGLSNVANVDTTDASNITSGTLADTQLSGNVTLQGNSFNGANELVKLDSDSKLPTSDASNLYNLPNEIFSNIETSTGVKFVDGKTIYRKVIPFVNIYGTIVLDSTLKTTYVDNLITCYGGFNGARYTVGISNAASDKSNAVSLFLDVNGLTAIVNSFAGSTNKGHVIIEYTKL